MNKSSFTIVIPCYNESSAIEVFVDESMKFLTQFKQYFPEFSLNFCVVDNNSTDRSAEKLAELVKDTPLVDYFTITSCATQGYGAALKAGFQHKPAQWMGFADLDNTYPLFSFVPMLKIATRSTVDMVMASRMQPGSEMNSIRKFGNWFYLKWVNALFNAQLSDTCSGMRIFNKNRLDEVTSLERDDLSFSIQLTAFALKNKWSVSEYPIAYRDRLGRSKLSVFKDGITFFVVLLKTKFGSREATL